MTIHFYLPRYKSKYPEQTIFCRFYENKKEFNLNTGEKVNPNYWDKEQQRASIRSTKNPLLKSVLSDLNETLDLYQFKAKKIYKDIKDRNFSASFEEIKRGIIGGFDQKEEITVVSIYDEFLKFKEREGKIVFRTIQKHKRVKSILQDFEKYKRKKLLFSDVNEDFINEIFQYIVNEINLINVTAIKNIQHFKTYLYWCANKKRGYLDNTDFAAYKFEKNNEFEVIYLTSDELMKLYNLDIVNEKLQRVRDSFCFQCFTGVRFSDLEKIEWEDIRNSTWSFRSMKTRDLLNIPLSGFALSIITKYKDHVKPLIIISNQKTNLYLKELCKLAEINSLTTITRQQGNEWKKITKPKYEFIGTHTARRTFITLSIEKGMKPDVIMSITGHKSYRMMQKYLTIAEKHARDEMDKVWGSPLRILK
ncbi:MAG: tyrosine-type recombinase/integrase [Ignavibacteriae bacterium]|nr:tyrosine-type recombinase/integrase [Ignavibacteriota bacterium]